MEAWPVFPKARLIVAALVATAGASPAMAASAQDVRCFLLSSVFAQNSQKEEGRKLARDTGLFYVGKLQGTNDAELQRMIGQQQKVNIAPADAAKEMQSCAQAVQGSLQRLQTLLPRPAPAQPRK